MRCFSDEPLARQRFADKHEDKCYGVSFWKEFSN